MYTLKLFPVKNTQKNMQQGYVAYFICLKNNVIYLKVHFSLMQFSDYNL